MGLEPFRRAVGLAQRFACHGGCFKDRAPSEIAAEYADRERRPDLGDQG